jgi:hypothetical protein
MRPARAGLAGRQIETFLLFLLQIAETPFAKHFLETTKQA